MRGGTVSTEGAKEEHGPKQVAVSASRHLRYIDLDEAVAMLFVILYHSRRYPVDILEGDVFGYSVTCFLSTCVPIFFLVNGYLLFRKELDLRKHAKKTLRLCLATIAWGFIIPVIMNLLTGSNLGVREIFDIGWNYKSGWNNQLWFMGALVCIYLLYPLIKAAYDTNRKAFYCFTVVCMVLTFGNDLLNEVGSIILALFGQAQLLDINFFGNFNVLRGLYGFSFSYFCLGGLLWSKQEVLARMVQGKARLGFAGLIVASTVLMTLWGGFATAVKGDYWDPVWNGYGTIYTLCNTLAFFVLAMSYEGGGRCLERVVSLVSGNTLGIMFVHNIVITGLNLLIWGNEFFSAFVASFLGSVSFAVVVLAISTAITVGLKKIPVVRQIV